MASQRQITELLLDMLDGFDPAADPGANVVALRALIPEMERVGMMPKPGEVNFERMVYLLMATGPLVHRLVNLLAVERRVSPDVVLGELHEWAGDIS